MSLRRIPGTDRSYHLVRYDKKGREVADPDGTRGSEAVVTAVSDPATAITDVFVISHGWHGDFDDAIDQYDRWLGAGNPDGRGDGIRPLAVGVHWPSKAWSDRDLVAAPDGLLGSPVPAADAITVDDAIEEYGARLGDTPQVRDALRVILECAADIDPERAADTGDELPRDVADAYRTLAGSLATDVDEPLLGIGWDPDGVFAEATTATADDGLLGDGWFHRLREAVLTPLRQLTFWHAKNQAREFGERGAADLVRRIMAASSARIHLVGHSFGTIVMAGAVRGPGADPTPPRRPVDSLALVQGAVSLWAFSPDVPDEVGGGRGYFADIVDPAYVRGPIVATRSQHDHAVGRFYPLAVGIAGQYLLAGAPKYGGIGAWGIQGVPGSIELDPLRPGDESVARLRAGVCNIDAGAVIATLSGASGAHNDLAHPELQWLVWSAAMHDR